MVPAGYGRPVKNGFAIIQTSRKERRSNMNESVSKELEYWRDVNARTSEHSSSVSLGSWNEADKLDETDD